MDPKGTCEYWKSKICSISTYLHLCIWWHTYAHTPLVSKPSWSVYIMNWGVTNKIWLHFTCYLLKHQTSGIAFFFCQFNTNKGYYTSYITVLLTMLLRFSNMITWYENLLSDSQSLQWITHIRLRSLLIDFYTAQKSMETNSRLEQREKYTQKSKTV